jgi:adenylate cyclase
MKTKIIIFSVSPSSLQALLQPVNSLFETTITELYTPHSGMRAPGVDVILVHTDHYGDREAAALENIQLSPGALMKPVILLCREISFKHRIEALQAGVSEILNPPYAADELVMRIHRLAKYERALGERDALQDRLSRLSQYFSVDVADKIMNEQTLGKNYGENLDATIFFLDIRNFTSISETLEPNLVASLLNHLFTDIMDLVLTYKGSVNKIIGDALLSTFGCPVRGDNDARNAVECALAVREAVKAFNNAKPEWLTEDISIGMGIATGRVFAGTIGSFRKMDYTVIGDTVNIASRLEGLTKKTKFDLIIDEKTRKLIGNDIAVRRLQLNRIRGRTQPMNIFLVDGISQAQRRPEREVMFFN